MINNELINKIEELKALSQAIADSYEDYKEGSRISDSHHILYAGNPESKIMVVQMHPDNAELNWAKRHGVNDTYVTTGPGGYIFKSAAERAGFDANADFFYANIIPFYPLAGSKYPEEVVERLLWIYEAILNIIQPKIIITLGYDAFSTTVGGEERLVYENILKGDNWMLTLADFVVMPMEEPEKVGNENHNKNKSFFESLKVLYTVKDHLTGNKSEHLTP